MLSCYAVLANAMEVEVATTTEQKVVTEIQTDVTDDPTYEPAENTVTDKEEAVAESTEQHEANTNTIVNANYAGTYQTKYFVFLDQDQKPIWETAKTIGEEVVIGSLDFILAEDSCAITLNEDGTGSLSMNVLKLPTSALTWREIEGESTFAIVVPDLFGTEEVILVAENDKRDPGVTVYTLSLGDGGFSLVKKNQEHTHQMTKIDEQPATQKTAGHKAYYKCSVCGNCFEDEAGVTEIANLEEWLAGKGKTEDSWEVQFNNYKLQKIAALKAMKKDRDSKAVTDLIDKTIKDIEESEYIDGADLNQNKAMIDLMVEETQKAVEKQRAEDEKQSQEGSSTESSSAQTGDMTNIAIAGLAVCVLAVGVYVIRKRKEF